MWLVNINQFGNHVPGDLVMIPDGAIFDHTYYCEAEIEVDDVRGVVLAKVVRDRVPEPPIVVKEKE